MDESRKQFEAGMSKLGDCVDMRRSKNGDGEYMAWDVRLAWVFWRLSRATIEIDLPEIIMGDNGDGKPWLWMYASEVKDAILAAGIKVKE